MFFPLFLSMTGKKLPVFLGKSEKITDFS
jgi:hypothetical protein